MPSIIRPRRSVLFMPGSNARALEKAKTLPADALIFDLEDAVAPDAKEKARQMVCHAVRAGGYGKRELIVRVNALATPWGDVDLWQREKVEEGALAEFVRNDRRLRQVMERLAYEAHLVKQDGQPEEAANLTRHQAQDILEEYLGDAKQAHELLDYVDQQAGLLIGHGSAPGRPMAYSFPHRTFQEYLVGCYLLTGSDSDRVEAFYVRATEGDRRNLAAQLGAEELFYNTRNGERQLLHLAYNLPANQVDSEQNRRASLWSGQMATLASHKRIEGDRGSPNGGKVYLTRLRPCLVTLLSGGLNVVERRQAGDVLEHLGDPRFRAEARYLPDEPLLGFAKIPVVSRSAQVVAVSPQQDLHLRGQGG